MKLHHSPSLVLAASLVVNKPDRPDARIAEVVEESHDLLLDLASDLDDEAAEAAELALDLPVDEDAERAAAHDELDLLDSAAADARRRSRPGAGDRIGSHGTLLVALTGRCLAMRIMLTRPRCFPTEFRDGMSGKQEQAPPCSNQPRHVASRPVTCTKHD
ncbi:hypothetical protein [Nocardia farcinica]|uniref:hypothetical protein n=1 Tax=Nocardia farcinica TaxID=37329 RepID=UPI002456E154|nr:hypothetical protein [Nocardia farcinica]